MADATSRIRVDVNTQDIRAAGESMGTVADRYRQYVRDLPAGSQQLREWNRELDQLQKFSTLSVDRLQALKPSEFERLHGILQRNAGLEGQISKEYEARITAMKEAQRLNREFQRDREQVYGDLLGAGERITGGPRALGQQLAGAEAASRERLAAVERVRQRQAEMKDEANRIGKEAREGHGGGGGRHGAGGFLAPHNIGHMMSLAGFMGFGAQVHAMGAIQSAVSPEFYKAGLATTGGAGFGGALHTLHAWNEGGMDSSPTLRRLARLGLGPRDLAGTMRQIATGTGRSASEDLASSALEFGSLAGNPGMGAQFVGALGRMTEFEERQANAVFKGMLRLYSAGVPRADRAEQTLQLVGAFTQQAGSGDLTTNQFGNVLGLGATLSHLPHGLSRQGMSFYQGIFEEPSQGPGSGLIELAKMRAFERAPIYGPGGEYVGGGGGESPYANPAARSRFREWFERGGLKGSGIAREHVAEELYAAYARAPDMVAESLKGGRGLSRTERSALTGMRPEHWRGLSASDIDTLMSADSTESAVMDVVARITGKPSRPDQGVTGLRSQFKGSPEALSSLAASMKEMGLNSVETVENIENQIKMLIGANPALSTLAMPVAGMLAGRATQFGAAAGGSAGGLSVGEAIGATAVGQAIGSNIGQLTSLALTMAPLATAIIAALGLGWLLDKYAFGDRNRTDLANPTPPQPSGGPGRMSMDEWARRGRPSAAIIPPGEIGMTPIPDMTPIPEAMAGDLGKRLTAAQLREAALHGQRESGVGARVLAALALAESGGDPRAIGRRRDGTATGARGSLQMMDATMAGVGIDPASADDATMPEVKNQFTAGGRELNRLFTFFQRRGAADPLKSAIIAWNWGQGKFQGVGYDPDRAPSESHQLYARFRRRYAKLDDMGSPIGNPAMMAALGEGVDEVGSTAGEAPPASQRVFVQVEAGRSVEGLIDLRTKVDRNTYTHNGPNHGP